MRCVSVLLGVLPMGSCTNFATRPAGFDVERGTRYLLDEILSDWHRWARGWSGVAVASSCAMFANVKSSNQWDSESDVVDGELHNKTMKAVDFHVNELEPLHRTALQIQARNLSTGYHVWHSARLPSDVAQRAVILAEARNKLTQRLTKAGIL